MRHLTHHHRLFASVAVVALLAAACGSDDDNSDTESTHRRHCRTEVTEPETTEPMAEDTTPPETTEAAPETTEAAPSFEGDLVGTFSIDDAVCDDAANVTGSYFRMLQPGGTLDAGPFIANGDSTCADTTFSGLTAGADGGLITGDWQSAPDPAFDENGNGLVDSIFQPVPFFAVAFAGATDPAEAVPTLTATDGVLTGDLSAFTAYYGGSNFNQGAPKPDGSGDAPMGTIDPETGAYVLDWTSQIVGGSFNDFVGVWHLEGTFTPGS